MKILITLYIIFLVSTATIIIESHITVTPPPETVAVSKNSIPTTTPITTEEGVTTTRKTKIDETVPSKEATSSSPLLDTPKIDVSHTLPPSQNITTEMSPLVPPQVNTPVLPVPNKSNELVRKAVVNILCRARDRTLTSLSGSGVIIDPRGIILTNAHIAQYFLLKNYPTEGAIDCIIRTGSPAYPRYRAELVYLSPSWIVKNASVLTSPHPTGTGEQDYAFLRITESINKSPLPLFDFLVMEKAEPSLNQSVLLSGYPASFLGSIAVERDLYLLSALSSVFDIYTFGKNNTPDLVSVGNTVLAQQGASGGAVASSDGTLLGIIVTTTEATSTAGRDLRAVTITHIERAFKNETGETIETLLEGDIAKTAQNFEKTVAPLLREKLFSALQSQ